MALEDLCSKQTSEIMQLNRLVCFQWLLTDKHIQYFTFIINLMHFTWYEQVQQYKHERECNSIIAQTREDKILRLESLMDGILPTEDFMEEELVSIKHEHEVLVHSNVSLQSPSYFSQAFS